MGNSTLIPISYDSFTNHIIEYYKMWMQTIATIPDITMIGNIIMSSECPQSSLTCGLYNQLQISSGNSLLESWGNIFSQLTATLNLCLIYFKIA